MNQTINQSVLIFADDLLASTLLKMLLKPVGFKVETAVNTPNVLREVESHKPDIILIDSQSMNDGLTLSRAIRDYASKESLPIMLLSNCGHLQKETANYDDGVNTHLYKPVSRHDLVNEIQLIASRQYAYV